MWKHVRNKLSASTSDSLARSERERRKALCKITREDEAGGTCTSVVGGGCLFYDPDVRTDGWSNYFILTSSKLIPKEKCGVKKYQVEFIKPKSKSKSKKYPLSSIQVKNNIYHVSSGLVVIFIDSHSPELKGPLFKHGSSSVLKDLEPRIGCKQNDTQFFFIGEKRYEYVAGKVDWKDDNPPSAKENCSTVLLEEVDKRLQAVGILNFEDNEEHQPVPVWWKNLNVEELLGKPVITNADGEVDREFTVTWSEAHNQPESLSLEYRIEWWKKNSKGSTAEPCKQTIYDDTHFKITGLEYNSVYEVKLFTVRTWGGIESDIRTFKTKTGLPGKPTITNNESEVDKEFTLNWSPPEANSSDFQPATYRLEWTKKKLLAEFSEMPQNAKTDETHFKIADLEYNSEYEVKLFAVNQQGDSEPDVRTFKTNTGLPEKPVFTNKEGEFDKEFILTWAQPEADSSDLSPTYRLEWREKFPTGFLEKQEHGSIVETYFKITGLKYESEYEVKLFAVNKQGESEPDVRMLKTKTGAPNKPTITNKEDEVDVEFTLTWLAPVNNSSDLSPTYELEWKNLTTEIRKFGLNVVTNQFSITDLEYDSEYEVKLFAVNKQGKSEPDVKRFSTKSVQPNLDVDVDECALSREKH
ncbi:Titin [Stylophora pistillata]|uniref:Titin n=1 Tax=Stylophora pistillata TaxID=50429 RepID=A0A2B4SMM9_STYPI|nr:Titin [Stylophora pistillata]